MCVFSMQYYSQQPAYGPAYEIQSDKLVSHTRRKDSALHITQKTRIVISALRVDFGLVEQQLKRKLNRAFLCSFYMYVCMLRYSLIL